MYSFNIILTERCNANCSHCYMKKNKVVKTLAFDDIKRIIDNMPNNTKTIVLTGGEIFLVYDLLIDTIKYINTKFECIDIGLESNGIYLYDDITRAKKILVDLKKMGVKFIRFSDDIFHERGGVQLDKVRGLKKLENEETPIIKYLVQNKALGIGNGSNLLENEKTTMDCMNRNDTVFNPYIFLDIDCNAYVCTWKCIPPLGNMLNDFEIIEKNLSKDFFQLIMKGKIEEAINIYNSNLEGNYKFSRENGQCMLCYKSFDKEK